MESRRSGISTPDVGTPFKMWFDSELLLPVPVRPLRSYSRRAPLAEKRSLAVGSSPPSMHRRLRRVRGSLSPDDEELAYSPVVSIEVSKDSFLEEAVSKTKELLYDKESAEDFARRLSMSGSVESFATTVSGFSDFSWSRSLMPELSPSRPLPPLPSRFSWSTSTPSSSTPPSPTTPSPTRSLLRRMRKAEDLRSLYAASEEDTSISSIMSASPDNIKNERLFSWSMVSDYSKKTERDTVIWRDDVACFCGRSFHPVHGSMLTCTICDNWFHPRCLGMSPLGKHGQDKSSFVCLGCEEEAFHEIAEEED